jgi:hypothetical protein
VLPDALGREGDDPREPGQRDRGEPEGEQRRRVGEMGDRRRGRKGRGHCDQGPDPTQRFTPGRIGPKYETSAVLLLAVDPGLRLLRAR